MHRRIVLASTALTVAAGLGLASSLSGLSWPVQVALIGCATLLTGGVTLFEEL